PYSPAGPQEAIGACDVSLLSSLQEDLAPIIEKAAGKRRRRIQSSPTLRVRRDSLGAVTVSNVDNGLIRHAAGWRGGVLTKGRETARMAQLAYRITGKLTTWRVSGATSAGAVAPVHHLAMS